MDSPDSNYFDALRTRNITLSLPALVDADYEGDGSDVVPGGETSPALVFQLYQKGSPLPINSRYFEGDGSVVPLDAKFATTPSEAYINMRDQVQRVLAAHTAVAAQGAAPPAAQGAAPPAAQGAAPPAAQGAAPPAAV